MYKKLLFLMCCVVLISGCSGGNDNIVTDTIVTEDTSVLEMTSVTTEETTVLTTVTTEEVVTETTESMDDFMARQIDFSELRAEYENDDEKIVLISDFHTYKILQIYYYNDEGFICKAENRLVPVDFDDDISTFVSGIAALQNIRNVPLETGDGYYYYEIPIEELNHSYHEYNRSLERIKGICESFNAIMDKTEVAKSNYVCERAKFGSVPGYTKHEDGRVSYEETDGIKLVIKTKGDMRLLDENRFPTVHCYLCLSPNNYKEVECQCTGALLKNQTNVLYDFALYNTEDDDFSYMSVIIKGENGEAQINIRKLDMF